MRIRDGLERAGKQNKNRAKSRKPDSRDPALVIEKEVREKYG